MGLFRRNKVPGMEPQNFDRDELFRKEKNHEKMTYQELEALQHEKNKELSNQILRVAGLFAVLFAVGLAVFVFLYPYSLFNLFATSKGGHDQFWDLWSHWAINVGKDYGVNGNGFGGWVGTMTELDTYNTTGEGTGFVTMSTVLAHGFQTGSTWKANFYCLGGWSIILVATVGFVAILITAAYIIAYNVKDLILVIRHFLHRTAYFTKDIAEETSKSVKSGLEKDNVEAKPAGDEKKDEVKNLFDDEPAEPLPESGKEKRRKEEPDELGNYSTEDLDRLLSGETLDK